MGHPSASLDVDTGAASRATAVRWRIVAVLLAYSFLSWFNRVSMSVAYDERIKDEVGISAPAMGWVYSALLFAYMLCMTPGGWFVDRRGAWLALAVMGVGSGVLGALTGVTGMVAHDAVTVLVLLLVVRAVMGVFTAPIYPGSGHVLAAWLPAHQRAAANGAVMGAALLGIACTYGVFGLLLDHFGWSRAFLITGGVTALLGLVWAWYGRGRPDEHSGVNEAEKEWIRSGEPPAATGGEQGGAPAVEPVSGWSLLRNRSLVLLTISYAAIGYFEYLFYFWMHYYFDGVLNVGKNESRVYSTIQSLTMAAGMLLGGWVADRLARSWGPRGGRAAVVVGGMLGGAALLGCGILATTPEWIVLWFALASGFVGATEGPCWATAIELGGRQGGTAAGIFNTGGNAGGVLAPVLTPLVSAQFGWPWGIGLGGLVCVVGACLWWRIDPAERVAAPPVTSC
jgi:ACS family glucarate transporter-like MFS transporter